MEETHPLVSARTRSTSIVMSGLVCIPHSLVCLLVLLLLVVKRCCALGQYPLAALGLRGSTFAGRRNAAGGTFGSFHCAPLLLSVVMLLAASLRADMQPFEAAPRLTKERNRTKYRNVINAPPRLLIDPDVTTNSSAWNACKWNSLVNRPAPTVFVNRSTIAEYNKAQFHLSVTIHVKNQLPRRFENRNFI
mmetsp:Transcript_12965/g.45584  ORF Transcript_12965/g.45584 Transcript_12965/m.45584 type:complete len:191 (-) Transcript_12965:76-648(-)